MPMRGELSIPAIAIANRRQAAARVRWSRVLAELTEPGFLVVVNFSLIGLLIALCFTQGFPNLGELSEVFRQYP